MSRVTKAAPREAARRQAIPVAGVSSGLTAAGISWLAVFTVMLIVWLLAGSGDDSPFDVLRASGPGWLAVNTAPVRIGTAHLSLLPWGLAALPFVIVRRATRRAAELAQPQSMARATTLVMAVSASYMAIGAAAAAISASPDVAVGVFDAAGRTFTIAALSGFSVVVKREEFRSAIPNWFRQAVRAGAGTALLLFAMGGSLVTAALVSHREQVQAVTALMAPRAIDAALLTALSVLYLPTVSGWGMAYLVGPGVMLGATSTVTVHETVTSRLPAFPLLAMLPSETPSFVKFLVAAPIAAGLMLYVMSPRTYWQPDRGMRSVSQTVSSHDVSTAAAALGSLAVVTYLLAALSGGSLGADQLAEVGADPVIVTAEVLKLTGGTYAMLLIVPRLLLALVSAGRSGRR